MPDQADDLRRFVAEQNDGHQEGPRVGFPHAQPMGRIQLLENRYHQYHSPAAKAEREHRLTSLPPETAEVYRAKLAGSGLSPSFPALGYAPPSLTDDLITYRRLWLDLKGELGREAEGHLDTSVHLQKFAQDERSEASRTMLDRMEQAETLAFYAHVPPATSETWESVREDMKR